MASPRAAPCRFRQIACQNCQRPRAAGSPGMVPRLPTQHGAIAGRTDPGRLVKPPAEIKFTRKIELQGDLFDRKPHVGESRTRGIRASPLEELVQRLPLGLLEMLPQS